MKHLRAALLLTLLPCAAPAANYGAYLNAQYAASQGDVGAAARAILTALTADPDNTTLQRDAFGLTLLAGDGEADKLAAGVSGNPIALLLQADDQARRGDWQAAELAYAELPQDTLLDTLKPLLLAWAQQAQGHTDKALASLQGGLNGHYAAFYLLHAALIADVAHRDGLATRLYDQLAHGGGEPNVRLSQFLASWQARGGHAEEARATIRALARAAPEMGIAVPGLLAAIDKPQVSDAAGGIAEVYVGLAGALRRDDKSSLPAMLVQLARRMAPDLTEGRLVQAEMAGADQHYAQVVDVLRQVPDTDPLSPVVQLHLANDEARTGRRAEAIALTDKLAAKYPDRPEPLVQKGDILSSAKDYAGAEQAYTQAIARLPRPAQSDWFIYYARGAAEERLHHWPQSEADMQFALTLYPGQPIVLNFLGFSWADQNRNLDQAHDMIQKALDQRPNDGEIVDSLGWVLLRQGNAHEAARMLEKAAEMLPVDPTITGHLGDAYWQLGRHLEAEEQWRRALVLGPEKEDAARIEARLKGAEGK